MFEVRCNGRLLSISPTYRGAEKYIKQAKKKDENFKNMYNWYIIPKYEIIEMELII